MKADLSKYLTEWYKDDTARYFYPGPVVTISREVGCPAKKVASELTTCLNFLEKTKAKRNPWRWISKEILAESANELQVDSSQIRHVFDNKSRRVLEDLLLSQSKGFYQPDVKIRNTIAKVIRKIANEGNAIIVGRGGVAITRDIPLSFHIYLEAPLEWRALRLSEKFEFSMEKARNYAQDTDKKRSRFRNSFHGKGNDYTRFDMKLNCMTLEVGEIVDIIQAALKTRSLI